MSKLNQPVDFIFKYGLQWPLCVRLNSSDVHVLKQIFIDLDYDCLDAFKVLDPKFIIDGGANIGLSTVFFAHKYPNAAIYAVEPEEYNFNLLQYNTFFYENITLYKSAIWNRDANLKVYDIGAGNWGFVVGDAERDDKNSFTALSIKSLLEASGFAEIDILKLDIEGAEKEVFSNNYESWLGKVKVLIIETHDGLKENCTESLQNAISNYNFVSFKKGEKFVFLNCDRFYHTVL